MIDSNVGVSPVAVYEVKRIDSDYFTDEYLILDLIAMAIEKIDHENQIYEDFLHLRLETEK